MSEYFEIPTRNDGGPAFPRPQAETSIGGCMEQDGVSLRDWIAGQALGAIIQAAGIPYAEKDAKEHARIAYANADAMLAARKKGGEE